MSLVRLLSPYEVGIEVKETIQWSTVSSTANTKPQYFLTKIYKMSTTKSVDRNYIKIKIYFLYNIKNKNTLKTDFGNKISHT